MAEVEVSQPARDALHALAPSAGLRVGPDVSAPSPSSSATAIAACTIRSTLSPDLPARSLVRQSSAMLRAGSPLPLNSVSTSHPIR